MSEKLTFGSFGEELVEPYYKKRGFFIAFKNYYSPFGEIDLIAESKTTVAFIEVKVRRKSAGYLPREAVNQDKIYKIKKTADHFLHKSRLYSFLQPRFDVAEITLDENNNFENATIKIIENAF